MKIRRLGQKDVSRILEIVRSAGNFSEEEIDVAMELVEDSLGGEEGYIIYVLEDGEQIVRGYVCYGPTPLTQATYDLYWIAVDPTAQGSGYGRALMEFVERDLKKRNAKLLLIETSSRETYDNTIRFYEKAGYSLVCRIKDFYHSGDDKLTFGKYL